MKLQKITLFVLLAAVGTMVKAQQKLWTLSECIDYAIEHNFEVKKSQNQVDALKLQRNSLKSKVHNKGVCIMFILSYCHPELREGSAKRFFLFSDSSLRSE